MNLHEKAYPRLLHLCHSPALDLERLTACWIRLVLTLLTPVTAAGMTVWAGDGLKAPKEGRKMPAVKKLYQQSANNSKPEHIFGHSFQIIGLLVTGVLGTVFAVPLSSRIHEGLVFSNRDRRTLLDKLVQLFLPLAAAVEGPSLTGGGRLLRQRQGHPPVAASQPSPAHAGSAALPRACFNIWPWRTGRALGPSSRAGCTP